MIGRMVLAVATGVLIGWMARAHTTHDRYIIALVERLRTESTYFQTRTDQLIHANSKGDQDDKR